MIEFVYNDGGRAEAGYKGTAGDCVCRAIAIATEKPYKEVYIGLNALLKANIKKFKHSTCRDGAPREVYEAYLKSIGWKWVPTMKIGTGCKVHLQADELPGGNIICRLSKHLTAVIDGVIHDTYDPRNNGVEYVDGIKHKLPQRCVYGYFIKN
jgi:hypothetical protein